MSPSGEKEPLRLFLVRHGQVPANRDFRFIGRSDAPLTAQGEQEAERLGRAFEGLEVDLVLSSPLRRALATARCIDARAQVEEALAEQDFGEWEGLTRTEVEELGPEHRAALAAVDAGEGVAPPGGESPERLRGRIRGLLEDLAARDVRRVVLVTHVGPIKTALALALDLPASRVRRMFLDTGTLTVVDWGPTPLVRMFNCLPDNHWRAARWMR